jgi:hypothetical protein
LLPDLTVKAQHAEGSPGALGAVSRVAFRSGLILPQVGGEADHHHGQVEHLTREQRTMAQDRGNQDICPQVRRGPGHGLVLLMAAAVPSVHRQRSAGAVLLGPHERQPAAPHDRVLAEQVHALAATAQLKPGRDRRVHEAA